MPKFRTAAFLASWLALAASSHAGVADSFVFADPIATPISNVVSYGNSDMTTYVGYVVGNATDGYVVKRQNNNNVKNLVLTFTATIVDKDGLPVTGTAGLTVLQAQSTYTAANASCVGTSGISAKVVCDVGTARTDYYFPPFNVIFEAPKDIVASTSCVTDTAKCNKVVTKVEIVYSEGLNDTPTEFVNSTGFKNGASTILGTPDPTFVQTVLPKGLASKLLTGTAPAPNANAVDNVTKVSSQFTEAVSMPELPSQAYAKAYIKVQKSADEASCTSAGNLKLCPVYETNIVDGGGEKVTFTTPVSFLYQLDGSMFKRPLTQILNNILIFYTDTTDGTGQPVFPATSPSIGYCQFNSSGQLTGSVPCIDTREGFPKCYKNNNSAPPGLGGDCAYRVLNYSNGFTRFQ